ncbi:hypothetical protein [Pontibacter actiniarum]|uniref:hypothetical protein n=1 Tax=Pontibacter actiniarum TaxID=323450 RepID=UPI0003F7FA11|nr:hypothetical protein [Pontibacter actiniarum]
MYVENEEETAYCVGFTASKLFKGKRPVNRSHGMTSHSGKLYKTVKAPMTGAFTNFLKRIFIHFQLLATYTNVDVDALLRHPSKIVVFFSATPQATDLQAAGYASAFPTKRLRCTAAMPAPVS